ncbi:type II secretion system protein GspJ [Psychrobacter frigidicola]|uniref:Type II secretion system protein J n=1 Tax=Psychrobacter frigidicola TaxID=45611 RepID=A0A5C7A3G0_9GAMM|nr:type II secretion system minor pseudopilin GspJ [Psychrobacter frigidicola]TXD97618.1 type II secretion system protein GspJ [Psychrobacter frigidicola]
MRPQRGFTLLELMVAMAIFAMLAVSGWQVFDSVNRARERAQYHADNLAVLQYAYLQLQQDMGQVIAYQAPAAQNNNAENTPNPSNPNSNQAAVIVTEPFMSLDGEHVSFVRFADPDPRYQNSPSIQRIEYILADERLIRRQYTSVQEGRDSISLDTILLEGISAGRWQAYLPEISTKFPNADAKNSQSNNNSVVGQPSNSAVGDVETMLLPKGIGVSFTYQDMPITWQWALTPQAIPQNSINNPQNNNPNNQNNNNANGNNSNNSNSSNNNGSQNNAGNNSSSNNPPVS